MRARNGPTFGSLFAGIGGLDLGLERAGWQCKWQVENDPYCIRVLEKHWPEVTRYGDIFGVDFNQTEPVDLICGGFPCQPFSVVGQRKGAKDERYLWPEFARAIRQAKPRWVLLENVPGLLAMAGEFGQVLQDLATSGYDAEWDCIPAAAFGAPHLRYRTFIIAHPSCVNLLHVAVGEIQDHRTHANGLSHLRNPSVGSKGWEQFKLLPGRVAPAKWTPTGQRVDARPLLLRDDDGVPTMVDRLRALGNAVVPQVAEWLGRRIMEAHEGAEQQAGVG